MAILIVVLVIVGVYLLGHAASDSGPAPKLGVQCPNCGIRPVETARKVGVVRGMIFIFRWGSITLVGCCQCVNEQVKANFVQNLVLGWWSLIGFFATPLCLLQNLYHFSKRPNSSGLRDVFNELGIDYDEAVVGDDGMARGQRDLMRVAAAVLKAVAAVEGTTSAEWGAARDALVALSDGTLDKGSADELMREVPPFSTKQREGLDEEQRLILLPGLFQKTKN